MLYMSREGRLLKNTSILAFGTICTKGIMFFMTPLYTMWLSVGDYGTFDLVTTYSSLAVPFVTLAVGEALFRFMLDAESEESRRRIASTAFAVYCVGALVIVLLGIAATTIWNVGITLVFAVVVYGCAELLYNYAMTTLRGLKHLDQYALGNIIFVLGLAVMTVVTVYLLGLGLEGILVGYAIGDVISVAVMAGLSKLHRLVSLRMARLSELKGMLKYSMPMIPNAMSWWIINASDRTIISIVLGVEANAVYAIANKLSGLCTTLFSVFHLSWQQSASESLNDDDRDKYYSSVFATTTRVIASICIFVIGINQLFFDVLFSADYSDGRYIAPILALAVLLSVQAQFIGGIYVALKWSKKNGATTLIAAAVNAVFNLALIGHLGLYAAALATLVAYAVLLVVRFVDVRRTVRLKLSSEVVGSMVLTVGFAAASYIPFVWIGIVLLCLSVICFFVMNYSLIRKVISMVRKKISR